MRLPYVLLRQRIPYCTGNNRVPSPVGRNRYYVSRQHMDEDAPDLRLDHMAS